MATRFYLENDVTALSPAGGQPTLTPAFDAAWGVTTNAVRRWLTTTKLGTTIANSAGYAETSAAAVNVLFAQFISAPLAAQTISGTVKGQMRALENATDADGRAQVVIWVVKPDGSSRGTLLAADASALSSEFATSLTNRKFPLAAISPATLTSTAVSAGDRLVVELGWRAHNVTATSKSATFSYGTSSGTDLAEDETTTAANNPWLELSGTVTFDAVAGRVTQEIAQVVGTDSSAGARVTQVAAQVVGADSTPAVRVTQLAVQVVAERDYAGWDVIIADDQSFDPGE